MSLPDSLELPSRLLRGRKGDIEDLCNTRSRALAAQSGVTPDSCNSFAFSDCAAIAAGINSSRRCVSLGRRGATTSAANTTALQECRTLLGTTAQCDVIASGCATGAAPPVGIWRPPSSSTPVQPPTRPPAGTPVNSVGRDRVGDEFGRTSTTGRTLALSCTSPVVFSNAGTVALPSVDIVTLPAEAGTVTFEYQAFDIPDRFRRRSRWFNQTRYAVCGVIELHRRRGQCSTRQLRLSAYFAVCNLHPWKWDSIIPEVSRIWAGGSAGLCAFDGNPVGGNLEVPRERMHL